MNARYRKPLLWGAGLIAGGALAILAVRHSGDDATPAAPVAAAVQADSAAAEPQAAQAGADTPPWVQAEEPAAAGTAMQRAAAAAPPAAAATDIGRSLADIRLKSGNNMRMADDLLAQLDQLEKSGKAPADVRLDALRNNLLIAKRAQALAVELAESTQKPDSPAQRQRNAAILAELQQLQGQLRYDVAPANLPAAPGRAQ
ncbi:MAG: hypothetical protein ABS96_25595 [Lysobacteraceae bacterium SCN 69-123]|mgnify:FL=1|uniref:hypothetical protein n=1 Tax=Stenotrophomonas acidaminiphila TaxID=128780 RepID=UPI00086C114E|nr:hypothetical protein [Stenotrophomonas acidaminiphila]MBN8800698.1 hypothetical protein [Stenotrophomonas acidaminiphila]MDF9443308.1 hypothetical protein [Stenotrophomonas acidaminiphila]ODU43256.1 MAG: hypothetical protein ABS96_25595 [Xanthomonadaceae bacterium SCN 69-123]OJY79535.1 MAG: hypothetical protein BGP18_01870 [Stenotrophomonas sp. 69-14]